ncbi:MAG: glycosyltransferase family 39 protein [Deltaproteobacteria bacterium]|nr:glycosyltransferase family 39 protein [Deltaproteobacteria bacterium]
MFLRVVQKILQLLSWHNFAPLFLLLSTAILYRGFLFESLWLDELVTYWAVSGPFPQVIARSGSFLGQSPIPYLIPWSVAGYLSEAEWVLRLPSLLFTAASCLVLYRLGRKFMPKDCAAFAVLIFIVIDEVLISAMSFRPYSLALFCSLLSLWYLIQWTSSGALRHALLYCIFTVLAIYNHYLFAGIFTVHFAYVMTARRRIPAKLPLDFAFIVLLIIAAVTPGALQFLKFSESHGEMSFRPAPGAADLIHALLPLYLILYFVTAFLLTFLWFGKVPCRAPGTENRPFITTSLVWYLSGPLMLFTYSIAFDSSLFLSRYYLWSIPGLALCGGLLLSTLADQQARRVAVAVFAFMAFVRESGRIWKIENWRNVPAVIETVAQERDPLVLLYSGLMESKRVNLSGTLVESGFLTAPLFYYPLRAQLIPIPPDFESAELRRFFAEKVRVAFESRNQFFLVCLDQTLIDGQERISICQRHISTLAGENFKAKELSPGEHVRTIVFNRTANSNQ